MTLSELKNTLNPLLVNVIPNIIQDHLSEMMESKDFRLFLQNYQNYQFELTDTLSSQSDALFLPENEYREFIKISETQGFRVGKLYSRNPYFTLDLIVKLSNSTRICTLQHFIKVVFSTDQPQLNAILMERFFELSNYRQTSFFKGYVHTQNEKLRNQSITDPLTGAYNRRYFYERAREEMKRAYRIGYSLTLMHIDLNNLKIVNDEFGHLEGDNLLIYFTKVVSKIRANFDSVFRFGGDEFVLLLPNCTEDQAEEIGNRLNEQVISYNPKASLSFGTAAIPLVQNPENINVDTYVKIADERMYRSKYLYKNQN